MNSHVFFERHCTDAPCTHLYIKLYMEITPPVFTFPIVTMHFEYRSNGRALHTFQSKAPWRPVSAGGGWHTEEQNQIHPFR